MSAPATVAFLDTRRTAEIELPGIPGSKVTVFQDLNVGQQRSILNAGKDDFDRALAMARVAIKSWNLAGEDGKLLEVTDDVLKMFPMDALTAIFAAVTGSDLEALKRGEVKKNTAAA